MDLKTLQNIFNLSGNEDEKDTNFAIIANQVISSFNIYSNLKISLFPIDSEEAELFKHPIEDEGFWYGVINIWAQAWFNTFIDKDLNLGRAYQVEAERATDNFLAVNNEFKYTHDNTKTKSIIHRRDHARRINVIDPYPSQLGNKGDYANLISSDFREDSNLDFSIIIKNTTSEIETSIELRIRDKNTSTDSIDPLSPTKLPEELAFRQIFNTFLLDTRYNLRRSLELAVAGILSDYILVSIELEDKAIEFIESSQQKLRCFETLFSLDIEI